MKTDKVVAAEFGGELQDDNSRHYELIHIDWALKMGPAASEIGYRGSVELAPMLLAVAGVLAGGMIWALVAWLPGLVTMLASMLIYWVPRRK